MSKKQTTPVDVALADDATPEIEEQHEMVASEAAVSDAPEDAPEKVGDAEHVDAVYAEAADELSRTLNDAPLSELEGVSPKATDGVSLLPESTDEDEEVNEQHTEEEIRHYTEIIEAALLVTGEPVAITQLCRLFEPSLSPNFVRNLLTNLKEAWKDRQIELVSVASGWRFQGKPNVQRYLERLSPEKPPRYSRAVMETLAIIAYRQPVTRGDIEAIRGVAVSSGVIKALEDRQWIEAVGHRETPGRPALYATTKSFLNDLGLCSLAELPPLAELDSSHLLEMPDAPTKAAEAALTLASPILSQQQPQQSADDAPPAELGDAGLCGEHADQDQEDH